MRFLIYKNPEFENDSYLIQLINFKSNKNPLNSKDIYLRTKAEKFLLQNISKEGLEKCVLDRDGNERLSLRNLSKIDDLRGTIYTNVVKEENFIEFKSLVYMIKEMLERNSRKCVLRFANSFINYHLGEFNNRDVTCLNLIHYYNPNNVRLVFRASDIKNELFYDIVLIYEFFIKPIFENEVNIEIYSSTGQNINYLEAVGSCVSKYIEM